MCKYSTGISVRGEDWDNKKRKIKSSDPMYIEKTRILKELVKKADDIIEYKYKEEDIIITGQELKHLLTTNYKAKEIAKTKRIVDHYKIFHATKKSSFKNKPQSLKDYTSTLNLLQEFEIFHDREVMLRSFNEEFLNELYEFMTTKRPQEKILIDGSLYKYKTKGELINETIRKRLDILSEFHNTLVRQGLCPRNDFLKERRSKIRPSRKLNVTLTIDEVQKLYEIDFHDKSLNEVRDIFVFICFTGLRWSDIEKFDEHSLNQEGEEWYYHFIPQKTEDSSSIEVFIPLCKIAIEILKKYNFNLKSILKSNQFTNRCIKEICKRSGFLNQLTNHRDKVTKKPQYRHELISCHKGRDTFITNLIETTPINELMKYTGHTKVSTLMQYVDKSRKIKFDYIKIFDQNASEVH